MKKQTRIYILLFSLGFVINSYALNVKIATLVPQGTSWAKTIKAMAKEVKEKTNRKVKLKIYYGGVQGDEPDVLRKTRSGQLHGGVFTGKTLGDIVPDIRSLEIPFNFYHDDKKAMAALKSKSPEFNSLINKKGYVNLGFYGIGKVYVVSTKKISSLNDLQGVKMWAWEGDHIIRAMMESLKLVSVPLALPDVMSSLSTGIIEAAYAPPLGVLALQWQNKIKYLIDFPTAYTIGALLITKKQWKKISPEHQRLVVEISKKHIDEANELAKLDNIKALETLKNSGVEFVKFSEADLKLAEGIRKDVMKKLEGDVLSKKVLRDIETLR